MRPHFAPTRAAHGPARPGRGLRRLWAILLFAAASAPWLAAQEQPDTTKQCAQRLGELGRMCLLYAEEHGGKLPETLSALYYQAYVDDLASFECPGKPGTVEGRTLIDEQAGYVLAADVAGAVPQPLLQDRSADNHGGAGIHVFYSDGSVRWQPTTVDTDTKGQTGSGGAGDPGRTGQGSSTPALHPDVRLTDIQPAGAKHSVWGNTQLNKSITGGTLTIGDVKFQHGLGAHSTSEITYDIAGKGFSQFVAYIGIDQAAAPRGSCVFRVLVDGVEVFDSGTVRNGHAPVPVRVDVAGAGQIRLMVTDAGDGDHYDHANWASAGFIRGDVATDLPQREPARRVLRIEAPVGGAVYLGVRTALWRSDGSTQHPLKEGRRLELVQSGSIVASWGLQPGDVILSVGSKTLGLTSLTEAFSDCVPGLKAPILFLRDGKPRVEFVATGELPRLLGTRVAPWQGESQREQAGPAYLTDAYLCEGLDDSGAPLNRGTRLSADADRIACAISYEQAPPASPVILDWYLGRAPIASNLGVVEGSGLLIADLTPARGGFEPGEYRVAIRTAQGVAGTQTFTLQ